MPLQPIRATFILSFAEILAFNLWANKGDNAAPAMNDPEFLMNFRLEFIGNGLWEKLIF